jgi:type IV pilus assembly protein PilX
MSTDRKTHERRAERLGYRGTGHNQTGVALPTALILLILVTLVGLTAIRGTTMQQKMASNLYDRDIALQNAEAALKVAIATYQANPAAANLIWHNCTTAGVTCLANPPFDTVPSANLHQVGTGTTTTTYTSSSMAVGQPQYVMENMGTYAAGSGSGSQNTNAENEGNDQVQPAQPATYIRITARSADPAAADGRAVVTLQALLRQ